MTTLNIDNEVIEEWLAVGAEQSKMTVDSYALWLFKDAKSKYKEEEVGSVRVNEFVSFFKEAYKSKFGMETDESINYKLAEAFFSKIEKSAGSSVAAIELLKKALMWYIFMHKSENKDGVKFNLSLSMFMTQTWLWQQCVQQSNPYTIEMIAKSAIMGTKDAARALKRGDLSNGFSKTSIAVEKEKAIKRAMKLFMSNNWPDDLMTSHPKFSGLFAAELPTMEYIESANAFLEQGESNGQYF